MQFIGEGKEFIKPVCFGFKKKLFARGTQW